MGAYVPCVVSSTMLIVIPFSEWWVQRAVGTDHCHLNPRERRHPIFRTFVLSSLSFFG